MFLLIDYTYDLSFDYFAVFLIDTMRCFLVMQIHPLLKY